MAVPPEEVLVISVMDVPVKLLPTVTAVPFCPVT
jgi:hypothetical protein